MRWVHWYNNERLLSSIGYMPPAEAETNFYRQHTGQPMAARLKRNGLHKTQGDSVSTQPRTAHALPKTPCCRHVVHPRPRIPRLLTTAIKAPYDLGML